jgi:ATP-dependent helicase/nuclease subunit A
VVNHIEIIAASAGSGKTHRLAQILQQALERGEARPEGVLAVTFTNKAAAELHERTRRFLVEQGRSEDAHRLAAARIGTVHGVCARLVGEFAFDLGLAPEQTVLDPLVADAALRRAAAWMEEPEQRERLVDLHSRMPDLEWGTIRREILEQARNNGLGPDDLRASGDRSLETFSELLPEPLADDGELEASVLQALKAFVEGSSDDTTKTTEGVRTLARHVCYRFDQGEPLDWNTWANLVRKRPAKKSAELWQPVVEAARDYARHPRLRRDCEEAIRVIFEVSAQALKAYDDYKLERGAIDFADQLAFALHLLGAPDVQEQLGDELDLVLVDEFQDTSPIQLAIFLRLAAIARRNVWVGDQKQSIYGFLGADPALMDAAIGAILRDRDPETLGRSWRSRPQLVRLTSDLFAPPFERVEIPAARVRLEPAFPDEPPGLGPVVERWLLESRNKPADTAALAAGVAELLADEEVRVRDQASREPWPVRPSDIAVLCLTNDTCLSVAGELGRLGIPSILARRGVLATPEGRLVMAGLHRWLDSRDLLAGAVLARLGSYAPEGDDWLTAALSPKSFDAFVSSEAVVAVDRARRERAEAGVLEVVHAVMEALGLRRHALAWGRSEERRANLDALLQLVARYVESCRAEGSAATLAGLLQWLEERAEEGKDEQATLAGEGVTISTWHGAKGLEWPIVVLFDLQGRHHDSALGVHVEAPAEFDFDRPLAGRWIRFWPTPFRVARTHSFLHERLAEHPFSLDLQRREGRENLRLLYVGWTRARDRLVLASRSGNRLEGLLSLLRDADGRPLSEPADGGAVWAGHRLEVLTRTLAPAEVVRAEPEAGEGYEEAGPAEHPPALSAPSAAEGEGRAGEPERIGERIQLTGSPNEIWLGHAFHGFLAADRSELSMDQRREIAQGLLERWQIEGCLSAGDLLRASDDLRAWAEARWPGATWHREWPLHHRLESGTLVRGAADLVLELSEAYIVIDHKIFPGSSAGARTRAETYAGQLQAYAAAITHATDRPVRQTYIHLPVSGLVAPVRP